jgi:hypothetical protein
MRLVHSVETDAVEYGLYIFPKRSCAIMDIVRDSRERITQQCETGVKEKHHGVHNTHGGRAVLSGIVLNIGSSSNMLEGGGTFV